MTRFLIVAACLVFPCLVLGAPADSTSIAAAHPNSLQGGKWALQFDVNGQLLSVNSFAGGVSFKRQFTAKSAMRFGVGMNGSSQFSEYEAKPQPQSTSTDQGVSLEAVYQRYWNPAALVNAYWTLGPLASYSSRESESTRGSIKDESHDTSASVGGIASLGVEWFPVRQFSFHVEYMARGTYNWFEGTRTYYPQGAPPLHDKRDGHSWSIGTSNGVRLGFSAYF